MDSGVETFLRLGAALAIGLLIGVERGWREREASEGKRIAGVRTYGLIGLLGGGAGLLANQFGAAFLGLAFVAVAGVFTAAYLADLRRSEDIGITSLVAGLLVFALGALCAAGHIAAAAAAAVVATLLLSYKPQLHRWVSALHPEEIRAGLKLLLISTVLLPVLPNRGYGPWQALNPYAIWWMVVLIAALSFAGYVAVRIGGVKRGIVFTGLFGGLASSTAVTLHFSRLGRSEPRLASTLASGILLASGTMLPRMVLVASVVNVDLLRPMLVPAAAMAILLYAPVFFYWRSSDDNAVDVGSSLKNPLDLRSALAFGVLLAVILVLGKGLQEWTGSGGVLALAAASGVMDIDAITLSLAKLGREGLATRVVVPGLFIAAAVNSLVKAGLAATIGGREIGRRVGIPLAAAAVSGPTLAWLFAG